MVAVSGLRPPRRLNSLKSNSCRTRCPVSLLLLLLSVHLDLVTTMPSAAGDNEVSVSHSCAASNRSPYVADTVETTRILPRSGRSAPPIASRSCSYEY